MATDYASILTGVAVLAAVAAAGLYLKHLIQLWRGFHGPAVITCPETLRPEAVRVDVPHLLATEVLGAPELRLETCSRWPERQDCGQDCLSQMADGTGDCLVRNLLARWYEHKDCVYCKRPIGAIEWSERRPALRSPEGRTVTWPEIRSDQLVATLMTHQPVCWNCHIAETFRREHPELVIERPPRPQPHA